MKLWLETWAPKLRTVPSQVSTKVPRGGGTCYVYSYIVKKFTLFTQGGSVVFELPRAVDHAVTTPRCEHNTENGNDVIIATFISMFSVLLKSLSIVIINLKSHNFIIKEYLQFCWKNIVWPRESCCSNLGPPQMVSRNGRAPILSLFSKGMLF